MPVRHAMLGLLYWKPMHGYLLRQSAQEYAWIYPMSNTNVYPALHGLEEDGFVRFETEVHDGRARKVYSITEAGVGELFSWLTSETDEKLTYRDTLVLKISMMDDAVVANAEDWLEATAIGLASEIEDAVDALGDQPDHSKYAKLTMEYGVSMLRLRLDFLRQVIACGQRSKIPSVS